MQGYVRRFDRRDANKSGPPIWAWAKSLGSLPARTCLLVVTQPP